jgi:hypothetical protein
MEQVIAFTSRRLRSEGRNCQCPFNKVYIYRVAQKERMFLKWVVDGRIKVGYLMVEMEELWFQQDGTIAHTARASMTVVRQMFPQHVVSRFGDVPWPPRSPDLSVCDFFLWLLRSETS